MTAERKKTGTVSGSHMNRLLAALALVWLAFAMPSSLRAAG